MNAPVPPNTNMSAGAAAMEAFRKGQLPDSGALPIVLPSSNTPDADEPADSKTAQWGMPAPAVPAANTDMAVIFLETYPKTRHDLAAIDPDLPNGAPGKIECATFFFPDEREKARCWIEARQGKKNLTPQ